MGDLIQFVPRAERNAGENLVEFIRMGREDLTAFGGEDVWGDDRWRQGATVVVFATKTEPQTAYSFTPMACPFIQFAKAYVRYKYSHQPVVSVASWMAALQCLEAALISVHGRADIALLNLVTMDVSVEKGKEFFRSPDVRYRTGQFLQTLFEFCREMRITPPLPAWKSPYRKPRILTEELGEKGAEHRDAKLPSNATMLILADLFAKAEDKESRYFTSIMILLMVAPGRISEVLTLPIDCIGWEEDDRGEPHMYLRWWAAKGKGATKKWIVPAMRSVVEEAVSRLIEIGEPARQAARFAAENPDQFMPHTDCLADPESPDAPSLTPQEFCAAMSIDLPKVSQDEDGQLRWPYGLLNKKWIAELVETGSVTYRQLAAHVQRSYASEHWPFIDAARTVKAWEALCLHRENEFHKSFRSKAFSWRLPSANEVNARMGSKKALSLFERFEKRDADGCYFKLTSHQLRHWLSTMSERAGMDAYTLAQWAGRADVTHNRHYDHRAPAEQLTVVRALLMDESSSALERFENRQPVTCQELGVDRLGTAKVTLYGMCTHDYAMTPCQKQRECMTCKEHVCIKGSHVTLERIKVLEEQTAQLLELAQKDHDEDVFGANRWVDNHQWKLAHVRAMRMALEAPSVPDGALVRIPEGHDPSAVQRTLMDLDVLAAPESSSIALPVVMQPLSRVNDA